jgi:ribosomal protein S18 acetylase RimI-like enzyme
MCAQPVARHFAIRDALLEDVPMLLDIEAASFDDDRISRRQYRHLISRGNASVRLAVAPDGEIVGSVVVLFSRSTATARIYSVAVAPARRGQGVGRALVEAAEAAAWANERAWLRSEIRRDNEASIRLFEAMGYRRFGEYADYYSDHMEALRYEKAIDTRLRPDLARVPYYRQTLDFTCGPAALIMAFKALDPTLAPDRTLELRLWREATTIFMTSGHGGCGPHGLALAASRRGFDVELHLSNRGGLMLASVRSAEKKEVMALVQADMEREVAERGIPIDYGRVASDTLERRFRRGAIPLVLISSWSIYGTRAPHWVVVTGFDDHFVYVNDPYIDEAEGEVASDSINMPIGRSQFDRMSRYGRKGLQAVVFIGARVNGERPS